MTFGPGDDDDDDTSDDDGSNEIRDGALSDPIDLDDDQSVIDYWDKNG